ncbi:MAG: diaminopimelate epimerase [Elusimicrobia bacterium]|nr:diaminopimelate epimerase [Elusimicrobiota bacterium]
MRFFKLSGAGNDFVLLPSGPRPSRRRIAELCDRRRGIGADGVLWVRRGRGEHTVLYWNADGSRAFCGNGTRCAAWWLRLQGAGKALRLRTEAGPAEAVVEGRERVRVRMPPPAGLTLGLELDAADRPWTTHAATVGVPHAVVEVRRLERFAVVEVGRALRRQRAFGRLGANANFVERLGRGLWAIRTYERGVEDETLACGSGVTASAYVLESIGRDSLPLRFRARGGDTLTVSRHDGRLWLEGPARVVFHGELP